MMCNDIITCKHEECRDVVLTLEQWNSLSTWLILFAGRGNLLSDEATEMLFHKSKAKNKKSIWYCTQHFQEFQNQKEIWWAHKFKGDFEIWREDHTVYQLTNGNYIVHK